MVRQMAHLENDVPLLLNEALLEEQYAMEKLEP
jgi:hypothetical protein